ncbi:MAG: cob(I)yrinic acid a,c-diamide adenosyltransferase [Bacillota bacterium]|nr:cob(I)yrinic acid a,c-diamide adenosyltransferase [Bacillota bacterium]
MVKLQKGLVHVYTGNGKGKTTAAVGLGVRAYGRGFKILMIQFLKGADSGEIIALERFSPDLIIKRDKQSSKFTWNMNDEEKDEAKAAAGKLLSQAIIEAKSAKWDMLILDEIFAAISTGFIDKQEVIDFILNKPDKLEVVLTGRNVPEDIIEIADYVSEINSVKHPFDKGINARIGIES